MPQGTIQSKSRRSVVTLSAKPCEVMACETWMPMAASLFFLHYAAGVGPDAGAFADALRGHAEVLAAEDQRLFHEADEVDGAKEGAALVRQVAAQVEDGIADELAGAVVRDLAATVGLVDLDAFAREQFVAGDNVRSCGIAAERENRWVLHEEQGVTDGAGLARGDDLVLEAQAFGVGDAAELEQMQMHI